LANETIANAARAFTTRRACGAVIFDAGTIAIAKVVASRRAIGIALPKCHGRTRADGTSRIAQDARSAADCIATDAIDAEAGRTLPGIGTRRAIVLRDLHLIAGARPIALTGIAFVVRIVCIGNRPAGAVHALPLFRRSTRITWIGARVVATDAIHAMLRQTFARGRAGKTIVGHARSVAAHAGRTVIVGVGVFADICARANKPDGSFESVA